MEGVEEAMMTKIYSEEGIMLPPQRVIKGAQLMSSKVLLGLGLPCT